MKVIAVRRFCEPAAAAFAFDFSFQVRRYPNSAGFHLASSNPRLRFLAHFEICRSTILDLPFTRLRSGDEIAHSQVTLAARRCNYSGINDYSETTKAASRFLVAIQLG